MNKILSPDKIMLNADISSKTEAIQLAGKLLVQAGHVKAPYIEKMLEREESLTTYMGNGVAIPHGTHDSKPYIQSTGISVIQVPKGVDFGHGNTVYLIVGIAAVGDEHLEVLSNLAILCSEQENVQKLVHAPSAEQLISLFKGGV